MKQSVHLQRHWSPLLSVCTLFDGGPYSFTTEKEQLFQANQTLEWNIKPFYSSQKFRSNAKSVQYKFLWYSVPPGFYTYQIKRHKALWHWLLIHTKWKYFRRLESCAQRFNKFLEITLPAVNACYASFSNGLLLLIFTDNSSRETILPDVGWPLPRRTGKYESYSTRVDKFSTYGHMACILQDI